MFSSVHSFIVLLLRRKYKIITWLKVQEESSLRWATGSLRERYSYWVSARINQRWRIGNKSRWEKSEIGSKESLTLTGCINSGSDQEGQQTVEEQLQPFVLHSHNKLSLREPLLISPLCLCHLCKSKSVWGLVFNSLTSAYTHLHTPPHAHALMQFAFYYWK